MAFHETPRFPERISRDSRAGLGFNTSIIEGAAGDTVRVARWPNAKRSYNAVYGIRNLQDISDVMTFYQGRQGVVNGFRWKDWLDYTSAADHRSAHANNDQIIGTGSGAGPQTFQLVKTYTSGAQSITRAIEKPVTSTVLLASDLADETGNYTVDTTTGIVTFTPGRDITGETVTAGFEFDVPVQFGEEIDEALTAALTNYDTGSISEIPIIEMLGDVVSPDRAYYGGGSEVTYVGTKFALTWAMGRAVSFIGSTDTTVLMPDSTFLAGGPMYHILKNNGTSTLTFRTFDDATALWTISTTGVAITFVYKDSSGNMVWGATA